MYFLVDTIYECRRLPMEQLFRTNGKLVILYSRNPLIVSIIPDCTKPMDIYGWFTILPCSHGVI